MEFSGGRGALSATMMLEQGSRMEGGFQEARGGGLRVSGVDCEEGEERTATARAGARAAVLKCEPDGESLLLCCSFCVCKVTAPCAGKMGLGTQLSETSSMTRLKERGSKRA